MLSGLSDLSFQPASLPVVTEKPTSPICPECHSSVNRVPRRFIDRVLSLVYPVHRYHCRSFDCNWEGNLRFTEALGYWESLDADSDLQAERRSSAHPSAPPTATIAPPRVEVEPARRESDTLPMPPPRTPQTKKPDARAELRDGTNAPRRAKKRAKAAPR